MEKFSINKQLRKEILLSERLRAYLLIYISALAIVVLFFTKIFFNENLIQYFNKVEYVYIIQLIFLVFIVREIIVIRIINNRIKLGKDVDDKFRYITNLIEISVPSLILIVIGFFLETTDVLNSPAVYLYFLIIILSTLSLELKISVIIGVIAAVEYLIIFYVLRQKFGLQELDSIYNGFIFHFGKANILIGTGIISGIVAKQIEKKIHNVMNALSDRNKVISMFSQQVSSSIVEHLIENDNTAKSERKYVCVMFLDIRGFTPFVETKQPEEIIKYQNDVFGFMIEIITKHNGIINQFLGDGYMATFGAPISSGNDSQNAVNASIEIAEELKRRNNQNDFPKTKIGIGLHSGFVVAGNVGTNIRKQYSISGNTVILASRIEQLNKIYNSQILISKEVLDNISLEKYGITNHGRVDVKGREEPIEIYQLK